ncbi:hypothetical protein N7537_010019 [Penicillium hordei]|uniref:Aminoglycoside phosphotransferase domain-containing protein n=1 Tax=Penicillium hordei TaxID=40994 RepID=A0AAD6GXP7_9EURO|nr:uncharacterized protein N7537_010019 [Penicillium hordei]KAJ5593115.1 hypothetical protein N7537_010019 [Penicillium hordei]
MLQQSYRILFAHNDLQPQKIMIKDGNPGGLISGVLDFGKALLIWGWKSEWTDYVVQILQLYHAEFFMYSLMEKLLI